jgi:hypothetical protein
MPNMDNTGPFGTGPVGRGMGPCGGGLASQRGSGWGMGIGRGFRRGGWFGWRMTPTPLSPDEEKGMLEQQKNWLKARIEEIEKQLGSLTHSGS